MPVVLIDLFAHQGGWDEALFVAVPMLVLVGLLALAQRRAAGERDERDDPGTEGDAGRPSRSGPDET